MSGDTNRRDHLEVQQDATASGARTSNRPDTVGNHRLTKVQALLRGAAVRAHVIGRYLWAESWATTVAMFSQTRRLVQHGVASARLAGSTRSLRRAQLDLEEKLYQIGSGDPAMRDAVRELDDQIKKALEGRHSASEPTVKPEVKTQLKPSPAIATKSSTPYAQQSGSRHSGGVTRNSSSPKRDTGKSAPKTPRQVTRD